MMLDSMRPKPFEESVGNNSIGAIHEYDEAKFRIHDDMFWACDVCGFA